MYWKTLGGRCIYSVDNIKVWDNGLFCWLTFSNSGIQTLLFKHSPRRFGLCYISAMLLAVSQSANNCCVLGLGGGGIVHALSQYAQLSITGVEVSATVIHLGKQFFKLDAISQLTIYQEDAYHYINNSTTLFCSILVDLFTADAFPISCKNIEFLTACKNRLMPEGILAINISLPSDHSLIFSWIKSLFGKATLTIPIPKTSNVVIIAYNKSSFTLNDLPKENACKIFWDPVWGMMLDLL